MSIRYVSYPECASCYFRFKAPQICEECDGADQYEPNDDDDTLKKLKAVRFDDSILDEDCE
jgi:hypothetical protein